MLSLSDMDWLPEEEYYAQLPRKRVAAGALFFDEEDNVLILKPSYKDGWTIPGGVVDANESPLDACRREVQEEVGLEFSRNDFSLLAISHTLPPKNKAWRTDAIHITFLGPRIARTGVRIDNDEITDFRFIDSNEISHYLLGKFATRIQKIIQAYKMQQTPLYIDEQLL